MHIHLVAICGVGMAPLAVMLRRAGHRVTGSDKVAFPPMSTVLAEAGIEIQEGFDPAHLDPAPDLVIIGNAVPGTNPEAVECERLGLDPMSFPQAVSEFFLADCRSLVIAGTHGKTTTTGMLATALEAAGLDPGYLIGGLVRDLGSFARAAPEGGYFAIEGDEYDSAYFDKRPKFVHYRPAAAVITSVEFDHADIYRDLDHVKSSFAELATLVPAGAPLIVCGDGVNARSAVEGVGPGDLVFYGLGEHNAWRPALIQTEDGITRVLVEHGGKPEAELRMHLSGAMNALNATAAYALCRVLGVDGRAAAEGLSSYRGPARRQEIVGEARGVTVIDDFAHHPTAVASTLCAIADRFPDRPLRAVFEPRSNTSRRAIFQDRYAEALAHADRIVVSAVFAKANDPLADDEMLSTAKLVADLESRGRIAWSADGPDAIIERLAAELDDGEVVVCMSNGAFGNLPRRLLGALGTL
ncbi:MAG: Mur ligase family protein [Candidatus Binatia bacterium]